MPLVLIVSCVGIMIEQSGWESLKGSAILLDHKAAQTFLPGVHH